MNRKRFFCTLIFRIFLWFEETEKFVKEVGDTGFMSDGSFLAIAYTYYIVRKEKNIRENIEKHGHRKTSGKMTKFRCAFV